MRGARRRACPHPNLPVCRDGGRFGAWVLTPIAPAEAVQASEPAPSAAEVPVMASAELDVPDLSMPEGDFGGFEAETVDLGRGAMVQSPSVAPVDVEDLVPVNREEYANTFDAGDGLMLTEVSAEPLNVMVDGEWTEVSTTLGFDWADGWGIEDHPLQPEFGHLAGGDDAFTVTSGGFEVGFTLREAGASLAHLASSGSSGEFLDTVQYTDVFENADLEYDVQPGSVKETIVLSEPPAVGENRWVWDVDAPGLTLVRGPDGEIRFKDAGGAVVLEIPRMVMWDSAATPAVTGVANSFSHSADGTWRVTAIASDEWLDDDARVYPVSVDPTVSYVTPTVVMGYKSDGVTDGSMIRVGNTRQSNTNKYWRSLVGWPYQYYFGTQVVDAHVYGAYREGSTSTIAGDIYRAACSGYSCNGAYLGTVAFTGGSEWATSSGNTAFAGEVATLVNGGATGGAFLLTGYEGSTYTYKGVYANLYVWWQALPSTPTVDTTVSPTGGVRKGAVFKVSSAVVPESGLEYQYRVSTSAATLDSGATYTSNWSGAQTHQAQSGVLTGGTLYYWKGCVRAGGGLDGWLGTNTVKCSAVNSFIANSPAPTPAQGSSTLVDDFIATTLTPGFHAPTVTDANGDPVLYQFRIATGADGTTGAIVRSGWLATPDWTVPAGSLQNGGSYTWSIVTDDGYDKNPPTWVNSFKVDMRLGATGPSPFDSAGPVAVNLASGNASLSFASPMVNTLGGPMGMSFAYNSLLPSTGYGLTGSYYQGVTPTAWTTFATEQPVMVRVDPQINFDWGSGSPGPAVGDDNFLARWSGYIKVPTAGNWRFGVTRDNGAVLWLDGYTMLNEGGNNTTATKQFGMLIGMYANHPYPFRVDYFEDNGVAGLELWARPPGGTGSTDLLVPSDWLSPGIASLPAGWTSSAPIAGSASMYTSAAVSDGAVTLTDVAGGVHTYSRTKGGYLAPSGEYGVLSLTAAGLVVLTDDAGTVYHFNAQGRVASITPAADALKPATPVVTYRSNGLVDRVSDPVSFSGGSYSREVRYVYGGDTAAAVGLSGGDTDATGKACPVPTGLGLAVPPTGMLCRIIYPGHVAGQADTTRLLYNAAGQLVRIVDPGDEVVTFAYDGNGRMSQITDPLAMDWLAHTSTTPSVLQNTSIAYDGSGRVSSVTLPAPNGTTAALRPQKTYGYGTGTTTVDVAGLTLGSGQHAQTVTYDASWRQLSTTSAMGVTASQVWRLGKDQIVSSTDPLGLVTTTTYDDQDRATDVHGPAPASCFALIPSCPILPAHSSTEYDQGLAGLHATYYANPTLSGQPKLFNLGLFGATGGAVDANWGAAAPNANLPADNFSIRMTGLITFPDPDRTSCRRWPGWHPSVDRRHPLRRQLDYHRPAGGGWGQADHHDDQQRDPPYSDRVSRDDRQREPKTAMDDTG